MHPDADAPRVLQAFFARDDIRVPVGRLKACLPPGADLWVIGGAPRNALIAAVHGQSPLTEDIDLFVAGVDPGLDLALPGLEGRLRRTELGGVRWFPEDSAFSFDIGLLARFMVIEKFRLAPTPLSLLGAIDFDVNAVMWNWDRRQVLASGWVQAVVRRVMGFNATLVFDKALLAYRILVTRHKIRFCLSGNVFAYLKKTLDLSMLQRVKTMLAAKQAEEMAAAVMRDCDAICRCRSHDEYRARMPGGGPA